MVDHVGIIDFGGQTTDLIRRSVEELGYAFDVATPEDTDFSTYDAVILSGGPSSVEDHDYGELELINEEHPPMLGICYGHQALAYAHGGTVKSGARSHYGYDRIRVLDETALFEDIAYERPEEKEFEAVMSHRDTVTELPPNTTEIAVSGKRLYDDWYNAGFRTDDGKYWGIQFHPEDGMTDLGDVILDNFLRNIAGIVPEEEHITQVYEEALGQVYDNV